MGKQINVALVGNPNTGKTSVFNRLTGLNQKVGNYPGITVEKKEGTVALNRILKAHILDLPGTYSLNATSLDENVVTELLLNKNHKDFPDVAVVVSDVENIKRNLLIFTQIKDLGIPCILAINMADRMARKGISINLPLLEERLGTRVVLLSARKNTGFEDLKERIAQHGFLSTQPCYNIEQLDSAYFAQLKKLYPQQSLYKLWLIITQDVNFGALNRQVLPPREGSAVKTESELKRLQQKETIGRYQLINAVLRQALTKDLNAARGFRAALDRVLTHRIGGYVIFALLLLLIFQAIYDWSQYPMDAIDSAFAVLSSWLQDHLPAGAFTSLLAEGVVPGIGGIVIFIPQIAALFLFIAILEETGYMSRVVFLMDRVMRRFGLSGKSVVPLVSGTACAIPAVMATRNIENWKERLITILVIPFVTCSARLPVYLIIIALVIPEYYVLGFISLQGLTLMLLYFLGFAAALTSAWLAHRGLKNPGKSYFVVEMPDYKWPIPKNVAFTVWEKTRSFVFGAGKIILAISVILWVLASNGPGDAFQQAEQIVAEQRAENPAAYAQQSAEAQVAAHKLRHSYIGIAGRFIEPAITPLGYDWKIGIALISSFAAREVFVGTLATIYSVGSGREETIKKRMAAEVNPVLGGSLFNLASGVSLLLFYAFAMQCMSTLAIVRQETQSWRWPLLQLFAMTGLAYLAALAAFQLLS